MITGDLKPIDEIKASIERHQKVLVLGCRGCVTVCSVGGEKEVGLLVSLLHLANKEKRRPIAYQEETVERQCDKEFIDPIMDKIRDADVVLSMACGAGVQLVSDLAVPVPVLPAINTTFIGVNEEAGIWGERCQACGSCVLEITGGICPISRCSKSLLNGPCGGSSNGKCEIDPGVDCAWQLIYDRLRSLGRLDSLRRVIPARDWSTSRDGGPRKRVKEDLRR